MAITRQIWERDETNEYIYIEPEPEYYEEGEDTEERDEEQVWIKRGVARNKGTKSKTSGKIW
jgi:hypothetical protein